MQNTATNNLFKTPILFIVFNKPWTTQRVFGQIKKIQPRQLFIACDAPRENNLQDKEEVSKVKSIVSAIDWPCEIRTLFHAKNLGCALAVSTAIGWFFSQVEEGIILEDDCLPDLSFFQFCEELLEKYRDDGRVMTISGNNFQSGRNKTPHSYYFSRFPSIWGWASWRRAWKFFDLGFTAWPRIKKDKLLYNILPRNEIFYWEKKFDDMFSNKNNWDFQWALSCWIQNSLSIAPAVNLVTNIGFGKNATHSLEFDPWLSIPESAIAFPLQHPFFIVPHKGADERMWKVVHRDDLIYKIKRRLRIMGASYAHRH